MSTVPPSAHVIAFSDIHDGSHGEPGAPLASGSANPLHHVKARLQVCIGDVQLTVGELMNLREHEVVTLNQAVDAPVHVLLEGKVVARGQLVALGDQFAVRVTDLPVPLKT